MAAPSAVAAWRHDAVRPSREPQNTQMRFMPIRVPCGVRVSLRAQRASHTLSAPGGESNGEPNGGDANHLARISHALAARIGEPRIPAHPRGADERCRRNNCSGEPWNRLANGRGVAGALT